MMCSLVIGSRGAELPDIEGFPTSARFTQQQLCGADGALEKAASQ